MTTDTPKSNDISGAVVLNFIRNYWVLLVFLAMLIGTFTENRMKFEELDSRVNTVEADSKNNSGVFLQVQKDIVEIKTSLLYIQKNLDYK